ncbi:uncharacterized protein [Hemitrygon akajei]|uniref:uncharacterized protein n=1 Tax=Hemitrygon akajei TaxID=2704970 RepID=UPI003BF9A06B
MWEFLEPDSLPDDCTCGRCSRFQLLKDPIKDLELEMDELRNIQQAGQLIDMTCEQVLDPECNMKVSTLDQSKRSPTREETQNPTSIPVGDTSSDLEASTKDQPDGSSTGQPTPSPSSVSAGQTTSGSSTGKQTDGSVSGEHTQKSSFVPAGDTSPGPGTSTGKQSERSSTGDFSQKTSSDPARDTASDQETSTGEQPKGSTTGGCIQKPSSAPMDTSGEEDGWIDVQVTARGDMSEEEVREAIRNKLREMFDDPDPQIELVQCTSEPPEE